MKATTNMKRLFGFLGLSLVSMVLFVGCEQEGPMEKAGERADEAARSLDPRGPMEKAGDKIDKAIGE